MRASALACLFLLGGCTTLAVTNPPVPDPAVRQAVAATRLELAALVDGLADPAVPDFAPAHAALEAARAAVLASALHAGLDAGLPAQAERAALGLTLRLCADGVARMEALPPAEARAYGRTGFAAACLAPLALF